MNNMTFEEQILRNDPRVNYTEWDIKHHLKDGVFVYESFEDFKQDWIASLCDEDDAAPAWERLNRSIVDGKEYRYDVAL